MLYTYRYRLYPTPNQKVLCNKHFGCSRFVYNYFRYQRIKRYHETGTGSTYLQDCNQLPKLKESAEWLWEVGSQSLQHALKCLQIAYERFFKKISNFPKNKKKYKKDSFRVAQNVKVIGDKLIIPKFQEGISIRLHRPCIGNIRHATISRRAGNYHVSILVDKEITQLPKNNKVIGLDLNVKSVVDDYGNKNDNPRPGLKYQKRLRKAHQRVSRRQKGSVNRRKACGCLAKLYQKTFNIREDHLHKLSKHIIDENQVICVEDLSVKDMLAKTKPEDRKEPRWLEKKRHKDIQDCAFYSFVSKLTYKALYYGRQLLKCDRWFPSSQLCNHCGWRYKDLQPEERNWMCWKCFAVNDRDVNSARNVKDYCLTRITELTEPQEYAGVAYCPDVRPCQLTRQLVG